MQASTPPLRRPGGVGTGADDEAGAVRRFAWQLFALALLTRCVWSFWIHPPQAHVFSDMARYLERATALAEHGPRWGVRAFAWQAWGTHALMAPLIRLGGGAHALAPLTFAWAALWAGVVPATYLLAARALAAPAARAVGWVALLWIPHLSLGGYFTSEAPFTLAALLATLQLTRLWQSGRGAVAAGIFLAISFALRPQVLLFAGLAGLAFVLAKARGQTWASWGAAAVVALVLTTSVGGSMWRFAKHTGYWGGVAENANMNLTAARCHNIVTQAFRSQAGLDRSEARGSTLDGRRVSLPGFRQLASTGSHPLALRPELGGESLKFVGYIGDPQIHRELRARCYATSGWGEQLRKSVVNLSLLWVLNHPWPEASDRRASPAYRFVSRIGAWIFALVFWVPSLVGMGRGLGRSASPAERLCALQLLSVCLLAAIFFGTVRLRTPYDPYAVILAWPALERGWRALRARLRRG